LAHLVLLQDIPASGWMMPLFFYLQGRTASSHRDRRCSML